MSQSEICLVVEGEIDAAILSTVLSEPIRIGVVEIKIGYGRSSAISLARTVLVTRSAFVILFLDADTTMPQRIAAMKAELEGSLADVARADRFAVILAIPTIEQCLFEDSDGLAKIWGAPLLPEERIQFRYDPKSLVRKKLADFGKKYSAEAVRELVRQLDIGRIRNAPSIQEILELIESHRQPHNGRRIPSITVRTR